MKIIIIRMVVLLLSLSFTAFADVNYSSSAHGNPDYGVTRLDDYSKGNCAHCHEQHASIDSVDHATNESLLFSATDSDIIIYSTTSNVCFQCHSSAGGVDNYDYSATFGSLILAGDSAVAVDSSGATQPSSILDAFNTTHGHNLSDVYQYAINNPTLFPSFKSGSNPCTACHDPHVARRNHYAPSDATLSVMSLPDEHGDLFGDGDGDGLSSDGDEGSSVSERMTRWSATPEYLAPFNEPDRDDTPDYNTFCLYCHDEAVETSETYTLHCCSSLGYLLPIDWLNVSGDTGDGIQATSYGVPTYVVPGDKHGVNISTGYAAVDPPFNIYGTSNTPVDAILSCVNCHEAHGSDNDYMHRRIINGKPLGQVITGVSVARGDHCVPCHTEDSVTVRPFASGLSWKATHHGRVDGLDPFDNDNPYNSGLVRDADYAYQNPNGKTTYCRYCHGADSNSSVEFLIPCENCHFHGSYVDEFDMHSPEGSAKGVKYIKPDNFPYRRKTF